MQRSTGIMKKASGMAVIAALMALVAALGLFSGTDRSEAADSTVWVGNNWFCNSNASCSQPSNVTITAGDTITWQRSAGTHTVTECGTNWANWDNGAGTCTGAQFDGQINSGSTTFVRTFNTPGTYYYLCTFHSDGTSGMRATVTVQAAAPDTTAPSASAVAANPNPTNGAASITLTATITDQGTPLGTIASAQYRIDGGAPASMSAADGGFNTSTENVTANVPVGGLSLGNHTIEVRGTDNSSNVGAWAALTGGLDVTAPPAGSVQASVTVQGGNLSNTAQDISFGTVALAGSDQTIDAVAQTWQARDARGTGDGWNLTVSATDFTGAGTIGVASFKVRQLQSNINVVSGNTAPSSLVATFQSLAATPLKVLQATAGTGMGTYDYTPDFQLTVPSSAAAGSYTANVTVSINSGP
jgi:plastocyanin